MQLAHKITTRNNCQARYSVRKKKASKVLKHKLHQVCDVVARVVIIGHQQKRSFETRVRRPTPPTFTEQSFSVLHCKQPVGLETNHNHQSVSQSVGLETNHNHQSVSRSALKLTTTTSQSVSRS